MTVHTDTLAGWPLKLAFDLALGTLEDVAKKLAKHLAMLTGNQLRQRSRRRTDHCARTQEIESRRVDLDDLAIFTEQEDASRLSIQYSLQAQFAGVGKLPAFLNTLCHLVECRTDLRNLIVEIGRAHV